MPFSTNEEALRKAAWLWVTKGQVLLPQRKDDGLFYLRGVPELHENVRAVIEELRIRGCHEKMAYRSKGRAEVAAETRGAVIKKQLDVYQCPFCGDWHLTKKVG